MFQDHEGAGFVEGVGNGVASQKSMKGVRSNADRVKHALAGGRKEVRRRQLEMAQVAHQLQYSLVEDVDGRRRTAVRLGLDGEPMPDAFDIAMEKVLAIHAGLLSHNRTS